MDAVVFLRDVPLEPAPVDLVPHLIHILRHAGHRVRWQPDPGCLFVDSPLEGKTIGGKVCGEENGMAAQTLAELFRWVRMAGGVALSTPTHRPDAQIRILTEPCEKGDHSSILVISGRKRWFSFRPTLAEMVADSLRGAVDLPVGMLTDRSARSTEVQIHLRSPLDDEVPRAVARAVWLALMTRFSAHQKGAQLSTATALQALGQLDRPAVQVHPEPLRLEKSRREKAAGSREPAAKVAGAVQQPSQAEANAAQAASEAAASAGNEAPQSGRRRTGGRARHRQLADPASGVRPRVVWESEGPDPFPGIGSTAVRGWIPDLAMMVATGEPAGKPGRMVSEVPASSTPEVRGASPASAESPAPAASGVGALASPESGAAAGPEAAAPAAPASPALVPAPAAASAPAAGFDPAVPAAPASPPLLPEPAAASAPTAAAGPEAAVPAAPASPALLPAPAAAPAPTADTALTPPAAAGPTIDAASATPSIASPAHAPTPALTPDAKAATTAAPTPPAASPSTAAPATAAAPEPASAPATPTETVTDASPVTPAAAAPVSSGALAEPAAAAAPPDRGAAHLTAVLPGADNERHARTAAERPTEDKTAVLPPESTRTAVAVEAQTYRFSSGSRSAYKVIHH